MHQPRPRPAHRLLRLLGKMLVLALVVAAGLAWQVRREVDHIRLAEVGLSTSKLDRPLRVLQVTDTHDLPPSQRQQVLDHARRVRPDLVAITGDVANTNTRDYSGIEALVSGLVEVGAPVFYVQGNHDLWSQNLVDILPIMRRHGVTVLDDRHTRLDGPWGRLDVIGTRDYADRVGDLPAAMKGTRANAYRLVLTHDPGIVGDLESSGADLAICGHTHGGQIRLPFVGAVIAPNQGWFPHYDRGLFTVGRSTLYIDQGAGAGLPVRLLAPAQVTLLTISPS